MSLGGRLVGEQFSQYCQNEGSGDIRCQLREPTGILMFGFYLVVILFLFFKVIKGKKVQLTVLPLVNYLDWSKSHKVFSLFLPLVFGLLFSLGNIFAFIIIFIIFSIVFYFLKRDSKTR